MSVRPLGALDLGGRDLGGGEPDVFVVVDCSGGVAFLAGTGAGGTVSVAVSVSGAGSASARRGFGPSLRWVGAGGEGVAGGDEGVVEGVAAGDEGVVAGWKAAGCRRW